MGRDRGDERERTSSTSSTRGRSCRTKTGGAQLQNTGGRTAGRRSIILACWRGHPHIVELLLKAGADPLIKNTQQERALQASESSKFSKVHDQVAELIALHLAGDGDLAGDSKQAL